MSLLSIFSPAGVKSSVWVNLVMIGTEELFFRLPPDRRACLHW